jgi:hypothetical protein
MFKIKEGKSSPKVRDNCASKMETKMEKVSLNQFQPQNHFETLKDNEKKDLPKIVERLNIIQTPKRFLKKCRYCNFKKRTCSLISSSCPARAKTCVICHKQGHLPQSLCCKAKRRSQKKNKSPKETRDNENQVSFEILKLIKEKINQLEITEDLHSLEMMKSAIEKKRIPLDLIPYLMMFIFLNHDSIIDNQLRRKSIMKSARYCARKFEMRQKNQYFVLKHLTT